MPQAVLTASSRAGLTQDWISSALTSILGPKMSTRLFVRQVGSKAAFASSAEHEQAIEPAACLEVAVEIGTPLAREAIWHGDRCTWLGAEMLGPGVTSYGTLRPDVYSGTAGVGLFLAALWQAARIEEVRLAAVGAIRQALAGVHGLRETNLLGLYTGALGVCWAAVRAAISLEESGWSTKR